MSTPRRTYYLALARRARALRATRRRTHERSFAPALGSEASGVLEPGLAFPRKRRRPPFPLPSGWDEETSLDPPGAGRGSRALSISRRDPGLPTPLAAAAALQLYSCRRGSHLAVATLLPFSWRRFFFSWLVGFPSVLSVCWLSCTALEGPTVRSRLASPKEARGQTGQALAPSLSRSG